MRRAPRSEPIEPIAPILAFSDSSDAESSSDSSEASSSGHFSTEESESEDESMDLSQNDSIEVHLASSALAAEPTGAKRKIGRPNIVTDLDAPTFPGAPTSLGVLLNSLSGLVNETNSTDNFRHLLYKLLQKHISDKFPSYNRARKLIRGANMLAFDAYPMCVAGCYAHNVKVGDLTPNQIKELKCPTCNDPMGDEDGKIKKVSHRHVRARRHSEPNVRL